MESTLEQLQKIVALNTIYSKIISNQEFDLMLSTTKFTDDRLKSRGDGEKEAVMANLRQFIFHAESFPFPGMSVCGKVDDEDDFGYSYNISALPHFEIGSSGKLLVIIDIE